MELPKLEKNEFRKSAYDMIYLSACAVNGKTPKQERVSCMDLDALFDVCESHDMTAICAYALESAGITRDDFKQAKEKSVRKSILFDVERSSIFSIFEKEGIWYVPLKGTIIKNWYPRSGMRQMSDNDIYFDITRRQDVRRIMKERGFSLNGELENVDEYLKDPVYNFELHGELFMEYQVGSLATSFMDMKDRMIKDPDNSFGYHFTPEDFYLFMTAHEYKHYSTGGTGVRSLLDTYIYWKHSNGKVNRELINDGLEKIGLKEHEERCRSLALKLFTMKPLTAADKKELDYYIFSGTYGTITNAVNNGQNGHKSGKISYVMHRLFPPMEFYKTYYCWAYKHKWLIPAAWFIRTVRSVTTRRVKIKAEIKMLSGNK